MSNSSLWVSQFEHVKIIRIIIPLAFQTCDYTVRVSNECSIGLNVLYVVWYFTVKTVLEF